MILIADGFAPDKILPAAFDELGRDSIQSTERRVRKIFDTPFKSDFITNFRKVLVIFPLEKKSESCI